MQARRQFDTGVDAGRETMPLRREPNRVGRGVYPPRTARSLAAVLLLAFAAIPGLPLQAYAQTAGVCGRTEAVRNAIIAQIPGVTDCADVTDAHLAAFGHLDMESKGITALATGDFDGLTKLQHLYLNNNSLTELPDDVFDGLTELTWLHLNKNSLTELPDDVFDGLTKLTWLYMYKNSLTELPDDVFDGLTELTWLHLNNNSLTELPDGVFDGLTKLKILLLDSNSLTELPDGVFEELTALANLYLQDNPGAPFSPTADALPDDGTVSSAGGTVTLDGSGSDGGPWGANVTYSWALTRHPSGVTVSFENSASATSAVTILVLAEGAELTFTLTVTGRGHVFRGTDTGAADATVTAPAPAANAVPSFTSPATLSAPENRTAVGTVAASDSDTGDSVTGYAIHGGADASKFSLAPSTGVLTFASAPNFEAPADADASNDYAVVVQATSGEGARAKTADQTITVTVTNVDGEAPGVPVAPTAASASATSLNVFWTAPANAGPAITDYDYRYRVKSPQGSWTEVTNTTITVLGATIAGLAENTEYEVQVRATNDEGTSGWSDPGSGSTAAPTGAGADAPQNLQAIAGNAEVTLTWEAPNDDGGADITGYAYRYKESGGDFSDYMDIPESGPGEANARSYTVTGLMNEQEYVFQVRAVNEHGGGLPAEVVVALPTVINTESEELPAEVTLSANYPNPFNPETTIRYALPQAGNVHLAVYDLLGHEVAVLVDQSKPAGNHTVRFGAGNLPSGLYVYRLHAGDETIVRTMMLVK